MVIWCFKAVMRPKDADGQAKRGSLCILRLKCIKKMQMDWQSVVVWCFEAVMHSKDADGLAKRGNLVFQSCNVSKRCRWTSKKW